MVQSTRPSQPPITHPSGVYPAIPNVAPAPQGLDTYVVDLTPPQAPILRAFEKYAHTSKLLPLLKALETYKAHIEMSPDEERLAVTTACRVLLTGPRLTNEQKNIVGTHYKTLLEHLPPNHPNSVTEALAAANHDPDGDPTLAYQTLTRLDPIVISPEDAVRIDEMIHVHIRNLQHPASEGLRDPHLYQMLTLVEFRFRTRPEFDVASLLDAFSMTHESVMENVLSDNNILTSKSNMIAYLDAIQDIFRNAALPFFAHTLVALINHAYESLNDLLESPTPDNKKKIFILCDLMNILRLYLPRKILAEIYPPEILQDIRDNMIELSDQVTDGAHFTDTPTVIVVCEFVVIAALQEWFEADDPFASYVMALRLNELLRENTQYHWGKIAEDVAQVFLTVLGAGDDNDIDQMSIESEQSLTEIQSLFCELLRGYDQIVLKEKYQPEQMNDTDDRILYSQYLRWIEIIRTLVTQANRDLITKPDDRSIPLDLADENDDRNHSTNPPEPSKKILN